MKRCVLAFSVLALLVGVAATSFATEVVLAVPQVWQHKDTNMW